MGTFTLSMHIPVTVIQDFLWGYEADFLWNEETLIILIIAHYHREQD